MRGLLLICVACTVFSGCARTVVKPVNHPNEHGVRFYRPKPYLKIVSIPTKPDFVSIEVVHLPDFTEEYLIKPITGIGSNNTNITLRENGTLESLHSQTDAEFSENVNALANLIGAIPKAGGGGTSERSNETTEDSTAIEIRAYRIPLGFYEAAVSRGPDGKKRLYGWKYVGFAPFNACPTEYQGLDCRDCAELLYGLVRVGDEMVFAALDELATMPVAVDIRRLPAIDGNTTTAAVRRLEAEIIAQAAGLGMSVTENTVDVQIGSATISVTVSGIATEKQQAFRELVVQIMAEFIPDGEPCVNFQ